MPALRYLSVCSGMEAASVAWEPLGFKAVGFSEIEPFPCAILKHRFPNTPNYGSLTEYQSWPIEQGTVDLLVGGTPCQSFSVAGLRKGLEDPRGNLALTFLGLADKLRPRWIVWENVPGVLSSNGGRDFASFLGALGQLGYGWAYRVLDAQHFGVPQRRRRVFVVATSTGDCRLAGEVLSLPEGLRGYLETRKQKRKGVASDAGAGVEADGLQRTVGTLCADTHPGAYSGQDAYTGRLIPDQKPIVIDRAAFNQGENAQYEPHIEESDVMDSLIARGPHAVGQPIPYRKAKRAQSTTDDESWVEGQVSNTLNNFDLGDTRTTHAVVEPGQIIPPLTVKMQGQAGWAPYNETAHILPVIDTTHAVVEPIAIQGTIIGRGENAGPQGVGASEGGPMFTLTKTDIHGVAQPITFQPGNLRREAGADPSTEATTTLKASPGDQMPHVAYCAETAGTLTVGHHSCAGHQHRMGDNSFLVGNKTQSMAVRRLTPVECERLQGFPDNWSRIPWKGKPEEDCPDGPRYKACGNSMAVPVMRWIGKRIQQIDSKNAK